MGCAGIRSGEDTRQQNNHTGAHGKFQADEFQADKNRDRVQGEVDHRIGNLYPGEFPENALDQKGDSVKTSGDQPSGIDKGVDVYRADDGGYNSAAIAFHFDLRIHVFQSCHIIHFLMFLSFFIRYLASQRPDAPQGSTSPLPVTGSPISWESTLPENFFSSVASI